MLIGIITCLSMSQTINLYTKQKIDLLVRIISNKIHYNWSIWLRITNDNSAYPKPVYLGTLLFANTLTYDNREVSNDTYPYRMDNAALEKYKLGWRNTLISNPKLAYNAIYLYGEYFIDKFNNELITYYKNEVEKQRGDKNISQFLQTYSVDFFWNREHYIFSLYEMLMKKLLLLDDKQLNEMVSILTPDLISKRWGSTSEFSNTLESSALIKWLKEEGLIEFGYGDLCKYPLDILILTNRIYREYPEWTPRKFLTEVQRFSMEVKKILPKEKIENLPTQTKITILKMEKKGEVYFMPCNVNGLKLNFIFDTGASDVSISMTEALFMLKNGYLSEDDILKTEYYKIANGEIAEGTIINLKNLEIGEIKLYNVQVSVMHNLNAPLLLGQSALSKLGSIEFNYSNNTLIIKDER